MGGSDVADAGFRSQPATRRSSNRWLSPPALSLFEVCRLAAERAASKRRACCDLLSWQAADAALYRSRREAAVAGWTDDSLAVPLLQAGGRAAGI